MKKSVTALCALAISLITTGSFAGDGTPAQWQPGAKKSLVPMKKSLTNMPGPGPVSERVMVKPGGTVAERPGGPGPVSERGMLKPGGLVAERPGGPGPVSEKGMLKPGGLVAERPGGPGPVSEKGMLKPGGLVAERPGGSGPVSERGMLKPGGLAAERPGGPGPVSEKVVGSKAAQQLQVGGKQRQIMKRIGPGAVA